MRSESIEGRKGECSVALYESAAELQRERKAALREVRRKQRAADTRIEKIERRIMTLLNRKILITQESARTIVPLWNDYVGANRALETAIADFISITSV